MAIPSDERRTAPRLVASCDVTKLPIGAMEGFVLSRVDGMSSVADIATMTGLGREEVVTTLERLATLGALELPGFSPPPPPRPATDPPPGNGSIRKVQSAPRPPPTWDAALLDEPAELAIELKRRVLDVFHEMEELDHYELLAVPRDVDRKGVKAAYYALASTFHTDRYFGKSLGSFKSKMEQIFGKVTSAHDTLANKKRREEYDEYLIERDRTRAYERLLAAVDQGGELFEPPPADDAESASPDMSTAATVRTLQAGVIPGLEELTSIAPEPDAARSAPAAIEPSASELAPAARSDAYDRARREALARRLLGQRTTGSMKAVVRTPPPTAPPPVRAADAVAARTGIKLRYEERREGARRGQAKHFVDAAKAALAKNDFVAAANQYRLAIRYTDDPEVHAAYAEINQKAREALAEAYLKQARYEESLGKWREAALSYGKAADGHPENAEIAERAANALRREGRDLHGAARYGEAAVQKNPNNAAFRVTLGHVYLDAGLFLRAKSELEQALKLAPGDAKAKDLLAHARKGAS